MPNLETKEWSFLKLETAGNKRYQNHHSTLIEVLICLTVCTWFLRILGAQKVSHGYVLEWSCSPKGRKIYETNVVPGRSRSDKQTDTLRHQTNQTTSPNTNTEHRSTQVRIIMHHPSSYSSFTSFLCWWYSGSKSFNHCFVYDKSRAENKWTTYSSRYLTREWRKGTLG